MRSWAPILQTFYLNSKEIIMFTIESSNSDVKLIYSVEWLNVSNPLNVQSNAEHSLL